MVQITVAPVGMVIFSRVKSMISDCLSAEGSGVSATLASGVRVGEGVGVGVGSGVRVAVGAGVKVAMGTEVAVTTMVGSGAGVVFVTGGAPAGVKSGGLGGGVGEEVAVGVDGWVTPGVGSAWGSGVDGGSAPPQAPKKPAPPTSNTVTKTAFKNFIICGKAPIGKSLQR